MSTLEHASKNTLEDYWNRRWEVEDTPWIADKVNEVLAKHFCTCFPDRPPKRAFVPLCGKTTDMLWLAERGCEVVGVELNRAACEDFFKENGIEHVLLSSGDIPVFKGANVPVTIYNCNLFDVPTSELGKFDFVWDRGSFVAIPRTWRAPYYSLLKELYAHDFHHLIEAAVYNENEFTGFPVCLTIAQLTEIIGKDNFRLQKLEEEDKLEIAKKKFCMNFTYFNFAAYLLSSQ